MALAVPDHNANGVSKRHVIGTRNHSRPSLIEFDCLSNSEMARYSVLGINSQMLYDKKRERVCYGPLDLKYGPSDRNIMCKECNQSIFECPGHFGHVNLCLPVYHPGFLTQLYRIAQSICKSCGRLLLPDHGVDSSNKVTYSGGDPSAGNVTSEL